MQSLEVKDYTQRLFEFLNQAAHLDSIRKNPQIIQAYEDALDLKELNI
jgi:hypothetical protein